MGGSVSGKQILAQRRTGRRPSGVAIEMMGRAITVLVGQYLSGPPRGREEVTEDAAVMAPVAIEIAAAFPWTDGREVRRLKGRNLPLLDCQIGDSDQADLAGRPWLRGRPFDGVVIVLGFPRRERIKVARRLAAPATIHRDNDISIRHPALRINLLPAKVLAARAVVAKGRVQL